MGTNAIQILAKIRAKLPSLWWYSLLMFLALRIGDVANFAVGAFLVPKYLPKEELGAILPLTQLANVLSLPLAIFIAVGLKYVTVYHASGELGKIRRLTQHFFALTVLFSAGITIYLWLHSGFYMERLHLADPSVLLLVGGLCILTLWSPMVEMLARGVHLFKPLIHAKLIPPLVRLLLVLLLLSTLQLKGYLIALLGAGSAASLYLYVRLRRQGVFAHEAVSYREDLRKIFNYLVPIALFTILARTQNLVEPWVIRQRLPEADSAAYYIASIFGTLPRYFAVAVTPFLFSIISHAHETGKKTSGFLWQSLFISLGVGAALTLGLALAGETLLGLNTTWAAYQRDADLIWKISLIQCLTVSGNMFLIHQHACNRFQHLWYVAPLLLLECGFLYGLNAIGHIKPYISAELYHFLYDDIALHLRNTVWVMLATRVALFTCICVHLIRRKRRQDA